LLQYVSVYINHQQGALSLCFAKVTMLTSVTYRFLKLPVLWLHCADFQSAQCTFHTHNRFSICTVHDSHA